MNAIRYTVLALVIISTGCSRSFGIQRDITAKVSNGTSLFEAGCQSSMLGDIAITVEPVVNAKWRNILRYSPYTAKDSGTEQRLPRLSIFQCVITCRGDGAVPLSDLRFSLRTDGAVMNELSAADIDKRLSSPAYSGFNPRNLFSWKRLLGVERCSGAIKYDNDIIDYRFDFLGPGDNLIRMVAMDWLPVNCRDMTLRVERGAGADKKSIDFEFTREEYRTKGKYFTRPDGKREGVRR